MKFDRSRVLILCNHHRRSYMFEDSMSRLYKNGYTNIHIQDTGGNNPFGKYAGPYKKLYDNNQHLSYDQGQRSFHALTKNDLSYDIVLLTDTDLFLSATNELDEELSEFIDKQYGYVGHLISPTQKDLFTNKEFYFTEIPVITFDSSESPPKPNPHWENAMSFISAKVWKNLTSDEVSHHRKLLKGLVRLNTKMGARGRVKYNGTFTSWEQEWFHIASLISYYYALERNQLSCFRPDNVFDVHRAGYFLFERDRYSITYPSPISDRLDQVVAQYGGEDSVLKEWRHFIHETCLENW